MKIKSLFNLSTVLLLTSALLISSCKKDDDPALTKTQLLTQHTWKYSSGTASDPSAQILLALFSGAEFTFKTNKTLTVIILGQTVDGSWEFSSDETKVIADKGTADETTYDVVNLDASSLELKFTDDGINFTLKFVKK